MYGGKPNKNKINSKQSSDHKWQINVINIKLSKLNLVFNGVNTLNAKRYKTKRKASSTHKKQQKKEENTHRKMQNKRLKCHVKFYAV